ncbi:hypothetical protein GW17_00051854 [Ensete ventricosum]|nr:hypothetical protein GW17_00051854 [Ensete ventricosum]
MSASSLVSTLAGKSWYSVGRKALRVWLGSRIVVGVSGWSAISLRSVASSCKKAKLGGVPDVGPPTIERGKNRRMPLRKGRENKTRRVEPGPVLEERKDDGSPIVLGMVNDERRAKENAMDGIRFTWTVNSATYTVSHCGGNVQRLAYCDGILVQISSPWNTNRARARECECMQVNNNGRSGRDDAHPSVLPSHPAALR